jgi:aminoglycoside 6-adenylyltransferase
MLDTLMREQLMKMLVWYFGLKTGFNVSPGKLDKYLKGGLDEEMWVLLERTYSDALPEHMWEALFVMDELFRKAARAVAKTSGFTYPEQDDINISSFIRRIRALPKNAKTI